MKKVSSISSHGPYQEKVSKKSKSRKSNYASEIKSQISIKSKKDRSVSIDSINKMKSQSPFSI